MKKLYISIGMLLIAIGALVFTITIMGGASIKYDYKNTPHSKTKNLIISLDSDIDSLTDYLVERWHQTPKTDLEKKYYNQSRSKKQLRGVARHYKDVALNIRHVAIVKTLESRFEGIVIPQAHKITLTNATGLSSTIWLDAKGEVDGITTY